MKLGILTGYHEWESYVEACKELHVDYEVVDILCSDWQKNVRTAVVDGFMCRPPCDFQELKDVYDERLYFIRNYLNKPLYPNFDSLYIYENKRNMAAFLEYFDIPHAKTRVFTSRNEAVVYLNQAAYPLVMKANIGSGGLSVEILKNKRAAIRKAKKIFGIKKGWFCNGLKPVLFKYGIPLWLSGAAQKHTMLVQEFHKIKWEWRILKIGNSYFGHQKLLKGDKASGSGLVGWVAPPEKLLYMVKDICEAGKFEVMDVDIFETFAGEYLVNELQAIFGSYLPYQMKVNDVPGRYLYSQDKGFVFEEGEFNRLNSKLLYVADFVDKISSGYYHR